MIEDSNNNLRLTQVKAKWRCLRVKVSFSASPVGAKVNITDAWGTNI